MIVPIGTHVVAKAEIRSANGSCVCPAEAVGRVIRSPGDATHGYRVRLVDGTELTLRRSQFVVRKQHQRATFSVVADCHEYDFRQHVIYRCTIGSQAYGLSGADSDVDRRGIYLPPADLHWSLAGVPEQIEFQDTQECYWELQKFLLLALKANPNILECLYTPLTDLVTPLARELLDMRDAFLSKLIYQTYNGYVLSQFKKIEQDIRNQGSVKWKHAMHLIRLLLAGITALREGRVPVEVVEHREALLAVRDGKMPWDEVNAWRLLLHREFDAAYAETKLPDRPDYGRADALLIKARRSMI